MGVLRLFIASAQMAAVGLGIVTVVAWSARWFWPGELLSHFVLQYLIGAAALTLIFAVVRRWRWAGFATLLLLLHGATAATLIGNSVRSAVERSFVAPQDVAALSRDIPEYSIVQFNVNAGNRNLTEIIHWLSAGRFDIVVLQEVSPEFATRLERLKPLYPFQILAPRTNSFGSAILSHWPIKARDVVALTDGSNHYLRATIEVGLGGTQIDVFAVHAFPPVSPDALNLRDQQLMTVARQVKALAGPGAVMIGDFNLTPYAPAFDKVLAESGLTDSMTRSGLQNSWPSFLPLRPVLGLPIDHILVSDGVQVRSRTIGPHFGSDHYPVIAEVTLLWSR